MSRPLRIVSVCRSLPNPDDPSGGIFVLNRLAAMADGARLRVIQPIPYLPMVVPLPDWGKDATRAVRSLDITHAPMLYVPGVLKSVDATWLARAVHSLIARWHQEEPIDLIDAHFGYPEGAGCMQIARRLRIPLFITIRGFENEYVGKPGIAGQMLAAMRGATGCIGVSHSLQQLATAHGVEAGRVRVIHNAIDAATFSWGDPAVARASLGIAADRRLIVSVGHLVSRKRHHVLIEAFAQVKREHPQALLAIIGAKSFETNYPAELIELARSRGVAADVRFVGNIPPAQVVSWLRAADVFALGTAREGCCNAVLEALAVGVPVVTTPVGDNSWFVRDGGNGYIVPVDDAKQFAEGIRRALGCVWDRPGIGRALVEQAGSWQGVGARVLDFMRERLEQEAAKRASA